MIHGDPKQLEALLDEVSDGIYFVDTERRITFWSRSAERLTGYPREDAVGRRCSDNILRHVDEQGRPLCFGLCPLAATMRDDEKRGARVYLHHRNGHRVPVDVRTRPVRDETGRVVGGVEVFTDATPQRDLAERLEALEKMAMLDTLTELPNRRFLEATLDKRQSELDRYGWTWGVLILDIDHFKRFNDSYGHDVGDAVLQVVAKALAHSARVSDVVGRWGGEEFVVVLANVDEPSLALVAERLRMVVSTSSVQVEGQHKPLRVTISLGGALATPGLAWSETLKAADALLYRAKEGGRNRAVLSQQDAA